MFLRDRTNVVVMAYYVVTCVVGVALSLSLHSEFVPRAAVLTMMCACALGLVIMLPYFAYVFRFLEPQSIIDRIRRDGIGAAKEGMRKDGSEQRDALQARLMASMAELTDVTSNSISGKDKIIASRAVDALKDLAVDYVGRKRQAAPGWFSIGRGIRSNPDFVAMAPESLDDLEQRRTWV